MQVSRKAGTPLELDIPCSLAPFLLIGDEWVRITRTSEGFSFHRGVLGCKPEAHEANTPISVHVMIPEGSTGVTEMYAHLLVSMLDDSAAVAKVSPLCDLQRALLSACTR